jgi:hypothetical protein
MLKEELDFFIANQDELTEKYFGKILVIKDRSIIGVYNTPLDAYIETQKVYPIGTFLIQPCQKGPEAYTITLSPQMTF